MCDKQANNIGFYHKSTQNAKKAAVTNTLKARPDFALNILLVHGEEIQPT